MPCSLPRLRLYGKPGRVQPRAVSGQGRPARRPGGVPSVGTGAELDEARCRRHTDHTRPHGLVHRRVPKGARGAGDDVHVERELECGVLAGVVERIADHPEEAGRLDLGL